MILTGRKIAEEVDNKNILIEPFDKSQCNPDSYDIRLSGLYSRVINNCMIDGEPSILLSKISEVVENTFYCVDGKNCLILKPFKAYLGLSIETISSDKYVPILHGRSSVARHGLMIHYAGFGDQGWKGRYVLELVNLTGYDMYVPVGIKIGQIAFHTVLGDADLYSSTYQDQQWIIPGKALLP